MGSDFGRTETLLPVYGEVWASVLRLKPCVVNTAGGGHACAFFDSQPVPQRRRAGSEIPEETKIERKNVNKWKTKLCVF